MSQGWAVENSLLGVGHLSRHTKAVELCLVPEVEARLTGIASEAGKAANEVVQGLVANYVDHDEWFRREVRKGLGSLDSGKFVSHEMWAGKSRASSDPDVGLLKPQLIWRRLANTSISRIPQRPNAASTKSSKVWRRWHRTLNKVAPGRIKGTRELCFRLPMLACTE